MHLEARRTFNIHILATYILNFTDKIGGFKIQNWYYVLVIQVNRIEIAGLLTLIKWIDFLFFVLLHLSTHWLLIFNIDKFLGMLGRFDLLFETGSPLLGLSKFNLLFQYVVDTLKAGSFFRDLFFSMPIFLYRRKKENAVRLLSVIKHMIR